MIDKYPTIDYHSYADDIQLHCRLTDLYIYFSNVYIPGLPTTHNH